MKTVIPADRVFVHNHVRHTARTRRIKVKAELEARVTLSYMALLACILARSGTNNNSK